MNLYRNIDRSRVQFDFLVYHQQRGAYEDEIESLGGKIYRIPHPQELLAHIKGVKQFFLIHKDYQIIHNHMQSNGALICKIARRSGVKCIIYHSHAGPVPTLTKDVKLTMRRIRNNCLNYVAMKNSTDYFACGEEARKAIPSLYKTKIICNAIDLNAFRYNATIRYKLRTMYSCDNKLVVGHVGRFDLKKNQIFVIEVFKTILSKKENSELWLIGDGEIRPQIENMISDLNLVGSVRLLGVRSDVNELLQAMDVFLFPSISEGLPVSCIEAQAAGLQCVFSDGFDPHTIVTPNCSVVSLSESPDKWADIILSVYKNARTDTSDMVRDAGYDIKQTSKFMESYYLSKVND